MAIPTAGPGTDRIDTRLARKIARSLNDRQAEQLIAVLEQNRAVGRDDKRVNDALHRRGLITYARKQRHPHRGGTQKTPTAVTDVTVTPAGRQVAEEWEVLHAPGAYRGPELGPVQMLVLHSLADHNAGRWWPGCGWSMESASRTVQVLDSLVARELAERSATEAGAPMFIVTPMGRLEARPHWRKVLDVRTAREARMGKAPDGGEVGHGYRWSDVREVDALAGLREGDVFVKPVSGTAYTVHSGGVVRGAGVAWEMGMDGTAWTVQARTGQEFVCVSHTGRSCTETLPAGVKVLKVVGHHEEES